MGSLVKVGKKIAAAKTLAGEALGGEAESPDVDGGGSPNRNYRLRSFPSQSLYPAQPSFA